MITHKEAEILTSARQDAPLDPVVERELQAHLATCDECRAFAVATERLTAGIKAMSSIPVNPRTRREVMEQVERGRNPFAGLLAGFGGGFQTGPVLAAAATLVIVGLFGWLALDRLVFEDGGGDDNQIAAVPTEQPVEQFVASPTQVPPTEIVEPTATVVPKETAEPTATTPPEPTATTPPEPTATTPPEPTATTPPEPTATTPPEPTATVTPTEEPVAATEEDEGEPTDLTTLSAPEETEDVVEPTATTAPTDVPTEEATEVVTEEATEEATEVVTEEATQEPTNTPEPEPTNTPGIEPMEGMEIVESDGTGAADPTELPEGTGSGPEDGEPSPIEPTGDEVATQEVDSEEEATVEASGDNVGTLAIEPMDDEGVGGIEAGSELESTPEAEEIEDVEEPDTAEGLPLADYSVPYTNIAGDPSGHLGLTSDGRLEFMQVPDGASFTTYDGFRAEFAESQPGVIHLCGDGYCEPSMEAPESETWQGDVPLGVLGETTYFMRLHSDRTEIYAASSSGTALLEPQLLTELGPTSPPSAVYESDGTLFAWLSTGQWLEISGGSAELYSGGFSDPYNVRFAPLANSGPLIGYFSGGTLVVAPVTAPDSPIFSVPTDGIDFDMTGGAHRIAVIQGSSIVIYDLEGNQLQAYTGGDIQPGSLIWLNSGIVYVDRNTGSLYQIPETAP